MAGAGELPHTPYYGSVDSTPLWLVLFGATFDWTGDRALVDRLWPNALARARLDRPLRRSTTATASSNTSGARTRGLLNQGWKDFERRDPRPGRAEADDADRPGRGAGLRLRRETAARPARPVRGEDDLADATATRRPRPLRDRFEAAFWVEDQRYYAMALDGEKRPPTPSPRTPGSACGPGSSPPDRARDVADRLLEPALFSGWGIRTYASRPARLQPDRLPHRVGLAARHVADRGRPEALRVRRRIQPARRARSSRPPSASRSYRLPELFCGFDRADATAPVPYPVACSPQAWAAGSPFLFLETMLGLRAHADRGELELRHPHLPDWLGQGDAHEPARRRRLGRPALPPLAGHDERGGAAQGRRRVGHDPALKRRRGTSGMPTIRELLDLGSAACSRRLRDAGSETARLDAELLLGSPIGVDRTAVVAHPEAPVGAGRATPASRRRSLAGVRPASRSPTSAASRSSTAWRSPSTRGR